jgi:MFS family permease
VFENLKTSPRTFKVLVTSALIENTAFGLIIPYLTLYMLIDIKIPIALIGVVLMAYTISGMPSMIFGGILADKIGRRIVLLSSLGLMSVTMFMYFFAYDFTTLVILAFVDSFVGSMYMPAANAMIADIIPSRERPRAFSMLRIAWNVGIIFGPVLGAVVVAAFSIKVLFVFGSMILGCAFFMNLVFIRETKPKNALPEGITFRRVLRVASDRPFALVSALSGVFWFFFSQWMSVLPVYAYNELG